MPIPDSKVIVEGHAIVSADGMIADSSGRMPASLHSDTDWRLFQEALDRSALVVVGRVGHERHPNPGRRRLVLTRSVSEPVHDDGDPLATLWNPGRMDIAGVLGWLGISEGVIAVTGGTGAFDYFLPYYDRFVLSEVRDLVLPDGIPCFSKDHPRFVLPGASLEARDMEMIDRGVLQTQWTRTDKRSPVSC